jgi:hypothetical protein
MYLWFTKGYRKREDTKLSNVRAKAFNFLVFSFSIETIKEVE